MELQVFTNVIITILISVDIFQATCLLDKAMP